MAGLCEGGNESPGSLKVNRAEVKIEFTVCKTSHRCLIDLRTRSQTPGVLRMSSEHATIRSEGIPNQAPETNKPMILNGPTSRNREGSDQVSVEAKQLGHLYLSID
ncbi:hypothetical protein ANN_09128 [Periplaneta americana]|uniref:Uncharacterized protein n=1 Tax=Periplaneta americana TaxID=6978 RepID=A0ABQ8TM94_PERAM|nr:hypothetical protein ANN_09128 [Periplaneta americana]